MKSYLAATLLFGASFVGCQSSDLALRFITYNIRWATPVPGTNEAPWSTRRPHLFSQLNYETAARPSSLVCMQEVVEEQLLGIAQDLGLAWGHVGVGRDDGVAAGEFAPIYYQPGTWSLVENRTYWLSETPDVPGSTGWDAALPRIVTVASFRHVESGLPLVYMCTHFDHVGQVAREHSAELLVSLATEWENSTEGVVPVFLGGDLNIEPDNAAYQILIADGNLHDVRDVVPESRRLGYSKTYTAFTDDPSDDTFLDHLFVRDPTVRGMNFLTHAVLPNHFDDGVYISDHRPVVADVMISV